MLKIRVIPTLLLSGQGLYKGCRFENRKYVGDPVNAVKIFNQKEVDELVFLDIDATLQQKKPDFQLLQDIASQAFMPMAYGGGLNDLSDIERIFTIGFEKAILNTTAYENPDLVRESSRIVGSQSIVVSIDVKKNMFGKYTIYTRSGTHNTKTDPVVFAKKMEQYGAGEIILCSIDREGSGQGYDCNLIEKISRAISIPVVASGGAGKLSDFSDAVNAGASAVSAGNLFTFYGKHKAVLITYPEYQILKQLF